MEPGGDREIKVGQEEKELVLMTINEVPIATEDFNVNSIGEWGVYLEPDKDEELGTIQFMQETDPEDIGLEGYRKKNWMLIKKQLPQIKEL